MEQIYFVLTERCNLSCSHCIRDSSPWRDEMAELTTITRALDQIASRWPQATILLSGGEPTIYRHFMTVLQHAVTLGLDIIVNSNGATGFFTPASLRQLPHYDKLAFQISLDGVEAAHDAIRGAGMYRKSLRSIGQLQAMGIKCTVSATVLAQGFFNDIERFLADLEPLGPRHIAIKRVTYAGRAADGAAVDTATWNAQVRRVRSLQGATPLIIHPMYDFAVLDRIDDATLATIAPNPSSVNCGAGVAKVYVYPSGDVCSCTCFRDLPMGNLADASLPDIVGRHAPVSVTDPACASCRYLALCRGGCLGSGYQHHGQLGMADPRCPRTGTPARTIPIIAAGAAPATPGGPLNS